MAQSKAAALIIVSLLIALLIGTSAKAQSYEVASVVVEGNRAVETSLISSVSGLTTGMKLSSTSVQEAIRRIYALGLFSDVQISGEFAGGRINIKITVVEQPQVVKIDFDGNDKFKDDKLKEKLTIFERQTIGPSQLTSNSEAIKKFYRSEGYYLAEVTPETKELDSNKVEITFKVKENERVKIRAIEFEGNTFVKDGSLRGQMDAKPKGLLRSGTFKQDQVDADKDNIVEYYRKRGFIDAAIVDDSIAVDPDGKNMVLFITVNEGNRYYYGDVKFTGNSIYKSELLSDQLKFKRGDIYNYEKFEESVTNLYGVYQEDGYIHVRIIDNVQTVDSTLNIEFEVSEGVPAHINKVYVEGNSKTKEKVIRRELFTRPGQVFKRSVLMRSLRNVMLLNYFSNVEPDVQNLPNGDIDVAFKVTEKPTGQIQAGAGYSGQDKLVGTLGLGIPNFRGNGQNVNLDWSFGSRRNSISISFTEPWMFDTPTSFGVDVFSVNRELSFSTEEFSEGTRGMGIRLGRRLSWPDDYFRITGRYTLEEVRYFDFNQAYRDNHKDDPYSLLRYENDWQTTSALGMTIVRDSRDLSQFATSGSLLQLNSEVSGWALGGDWKYHKHVFDAAKYQRIWWKFVLAGKVRVGVIDSPEGDAGIPYSDRFAPGGTYQDGVIRGYEDGTVGPKSSSGALLRGRSTLIYNLELQMPIIDQQIYVLAFADAGNAWLYGKAIKPFDLDKEDGLKKSVGAGFRIVIPGLGTIGFDFGYGYNNPDGAGWKPHFQLGTTF